MSEGVYTTRSTLPIANTYGGERLGCVGVRRWNERRGGQGGEEDNDLNIAVVAAAAAHDCRDDPTLRAIERGASRRAAQHW